MKKGVILSGMRTTGSLHLGNYEGALRAWVRRQDEYDCFFELADWHAMTDRTSYESLAPDTRAIALDWLAAGLDPAKSAIFRQSDVKEHAELHLLLSMVTPVGWLERVPTYKDQIREMAMGENASYAFLGYPVLQAADILLYRADTVPVGKDQVPHLELTREITRRFNFLFGATFPEPQALVSDEAAALPGTDGRKMSKSYGNAISLIDPPDALKKKVQSMITDPQKVRRNDPGHPEVCSVFALHRVYSKENVEMIERDCRSGALGCTDCKGKLFERLEPLLGAMQERRRGYEAKPDLVEDVLRDGAKRARARAVETMAIVRAAMKLAPVAA